MSATAHVSDPGTHWTAGDPDEHRLSLDRADVLTPPGGVLAPLASGMMLASALAAARVLEAHGVSVTVVNVPVIKPLDAATVTEVAGAARAVVTAENQRARQDGSRPGGGGRTRRGRRVRARVSQVKVKARQVTGGRPPSGTIGPPRLLVHDRPNVRLVPVVAHPARWWARDQHGLQRQE
jgi:hypothetical protein